MNKFFKILGAVFALILLFVLYQVYLAHVFSPANEPSTQEDIAQITCLESISKLKFISDSSCQGENILKINIKKSDERIKGLAFFDGQDLIGKSYDEGPLYEVEYGKDVSSFGYSAIINNEGKESICAINGGNTLEKC